MNNAFNFGEPSGGGFIDTHFDFKTCQRSDGTVYGVPNTSDCAQKGAKELKKETGDGPILQLRAQMAKDPKKFEKEVLSKLGKDGLVKLSKALSKSEDPTDRAIAKAAKTKLVTIEKGEKQKTLDSKDADVSRSSITNFFLDKGETKKNAQIKGAYAAVANELRDAGAISEDQRVTIINALMKKGPISKELKSQVAALAKENSPQAVKATKTIDENLAVARTNLENYYKINQYKMKGNPRTGKPGPTLVQHQNNQDEVKILEMMSQKGASREQATKIVKSNRAASNAQFENKVKEETRQRQSRAQGRINSATIEALKNRGCTWEQVKKGEC